MLKKFLIGSLFSILILVLCGMFAYKFVLPRVLDKLPPGVQIAVRGFTGQEDLEDEEVPDTLDVLGFSSAAEEVTTAVTEEIQPYQDLLTEGISSNMSDLADDIASVARDVELELLESRLTKSTAQFGYYYTTNRQELLTLKFSIQGILSDKPTFKKFNKEVLPYIKEHPELSEVGIWIDSDLFLNKFPETGMLWQGTSYTPEFDIKYYDFKSDTHFIQSRSMEGLDIATLAGFDQQPYVIFYSPLYLDNLNIGDITMKVSCELLSEFDSEYNYNHNYNLTIFDNHKLYLLCPHYLDNTGSSMQYTPTLPSQRVDFIMSLTQPTHSYWVNGNMENHVVVNQVKDADWWLVISYSQLHNADTSVINALITPYPSVSNNAQYQLDYTVQYENGSPISDSIQLINTGTEVFVSQNSVFKISDIRERNIPDEITSGYEQSLVTTLSYAPFTSLFAEREESIKWSGNKAQIYYGDCGFEAILNQDSISYNMITCPYIYGDHTIDSFTATATLTSSDATSPDKNALLDTLEETYQLEQERIKSEHDAVLEFKNALTDKSFKDLDVYFTDNQLHLSKVTTGVAYVEIIVPSENPYYFVLSDSVAVKYVPHEGILKGYVPLNPLDKVITFTHTEPKESTIIENYLEYYKVQMGEFPDEFVTLYTPKWTEKILSNTKVKLTPGYYTVQYIPSGDSYGTIVTLNNYVDSSTLNNSITTIFVTPWEAEVEITGDWDFKWEGFTSQ